MTEWYHTERSTATHSNSEQGRKNPITVSTPQKSPSPQWYNRDRPASMPVAQTRTAPDRSTLMVSLPFLFSKQCTIDVYAMWTVQEISPSPTFDTPASLQKRACLAVREPTAAARDSLLFTIL